MGALPAEANENFLTAFGVGVDLDPRVYYLDIFGAVHELPWIRKTNTWQVGNGHQDIAKQDAIVPPEPKKAASTGLREASKRRACPNGLRAAAVLEARSHSLDLKTARLFIQD